VIQAAFTFEVWLDIDPSFRRKPDKIAGSDFEQPKAGPKGGIQGCIPQSSLLNNSIFLDTAPGLQHAGTGFAGDESFCTSLAQSNPLIPDKEDLWRNT
jgi:hypothetical protein